MSGTAVICRRETVETIKRIHIAVDSLYLLSGDKAQKTGFPAQTVWCLLSDNIMLYRSWRTFLWTIYDKSLIEAAMLSLSTKYKVGRA